MELERSYVELKAGALEGVCTSVSEGRYLEKIEICTRQLPLPSRLDWTKPRSVIKDWQEFKSLSRRVCRVTPSYVPEEETMTQSSKKSADYFTFC